MGFIGGDLRESFIGKVKGADPGQLLAVPIDVGKNSATAMVCDFWGEIISPPFAFDLNERGFQDFAVAVARAEAERDASWVRVGLEQAGHYHRPLQARLEAHGLELLRKTRLFGATPSARPVRELTEPTVANSSTQPHALEPPSKGPRCARHAFSGGGSGSARTTGKELREMESAG
jgi:hypothetical protein